ncbi:MAG: GtrA family protein [Solirubrobacteraceae bacterium]
MAPSPKALGLRATRSALLGQGVRYAIVGAGVAGVYVCTTLLLHHVAGLEFQLALAIGFAVAVTTHFAAQRLFVWRHEPPFALPIAHQAGRYLAITAVQYGLTALSTSLLPRLLGVPTSIVYLATAACLTLTTFVLLRTAVFHAGPAAASQ